MEVSNEGQSFYHRFQGSFLSGPNGELLHCTGPRRQWVQDNWSYIQSKSPQAVPGCDVKVYQSSQVVHGNRTAVVMAGCDARYPGEPTFDNFFVRRILSQADLCAHSHPLRTAESDSAAEQIVKLFDSYLRYQGKDDKWAGCGRAYFTERIRHFTDQNAAIEFCLPAFPCKSSNRDKVTGPAPDRGEELALEHLHGFVEAVEAIYAPGAKLWIISDGHVFSDCIGVDDADVDTYGEQLKEMNRVVGFRRGNPNRVGFKSLVDLFQLVDAESDESFSDLAGRLNIPEIDHHINTKVTEEAELCRRILMTGCGPRKSAVRAKVDSKDAAITALYRGFSRFMLEDLEHHSHTQSMSRSQQKKLSPKVAFEMILRNQAYSNLVEMLFPNHVRLSIHAHNNAGPKFGIQLFDPARVRVVQTLSPDGELLASLDLLHIPTPWHNSVVQLAGEDVILVTKAKLARAAVAAGSMTGGLVGAEEVGAYFALQNTTNGTASVVRAREQANKERAPEKGAGTTVAIAVAVEEQGELDAVPEPRLRRQTTFSEKADAVATAVVRRNTGNLASVEPSRPARHGSWFERLRWIVSLLWPRPW